MTMMMMMIIIILLKLLGFLLVPALSNSLTLAALPFPFNKSAVQTAVGQQNRGEAKGKGSQGCGRRFNVFTKEEEKGEKKKTL